MGSVAILTTSGDNDPEIEPVQSYRHYLYCDACGSFEFGPWEAVDPAVERRRRRLGLIGLCATLLVVPLWLALPSAAVAGVGAMLAAGALAWRAALPSGRESLGLRCRSCGATCAYRTAFFTDLDANPRGLTASDVPRPLGRTEFLQGRYVGPAPTPDNVRLS